MLPEPRGLFLSDSEIRTISFGAFCPSFPPLRLPCSSPGRHISSSRTTLPSCWTGNRGGWAQLSVNEFLKTGVRAPRRKEATHILSSPKIGGGRREGWNHPKANRCLGLSLASPQLQAAQPGAERAKVALLKLKGNHPSPRSCECDFCSTHPGLEALEGLQLHGG